MPDFILLMHTDTTSTTPDWPPYLAHPQTLGALQGGSAIGPGICIRKTGPTPPITEQISGFVRITADNLAHAEALLAGNPVIEAGGTVEIRALPQSG